MLELFAYSGLINAIIIFTIGVLVLFKNPKKRVNQMFTLFCSTGIIWGFSYYMWLAHSGTYEEALFWARMLDFGSIIMPIFFLHWVLIFLKEVKKFKYILISGYLLTLFFISISFTPLFIADVKEILFFPWYPTPGILHPLFLFICFFGFVGFGVIRLWINFKKSVGIKHQQLKYIIIGVFIGFGGGAFNFFLIYNIPIPAYTNFFVSIFFVFLAYAILKYRLMDIRIVVKKSAIYFFTIFFIFLFSIILFIIIQSFLNTYTNIDPKISIAILIVILIMTLPRLQIYIKQKLDNVFLKDYIDFSEKIDSLEKTSQFGTQLNNLCKEVSEELKNMLHVSQVEFYILDRRQNNFKINYPSEDTKTLNKNGLYKKLKENREIIIKEELNYIEPKTKEEKKDNRELIKNLTKLNTAAALPIFCGSDFIGIILIGPKRNQENFSKEDLDLMKMISEKIGDILANVMLYQEAVENINIR